MYGHHRKNQTIRRMYHPKTESYSQYTVNAGGSLISQKQLGNLERVFRREGTAWEDLSRLPAVMPSGLPTSLE